MLDRHDRRFDLDIGDFHLVPPLPKNARYLASGGEDDCSGPRTLNTGLIRYPRIDPDNSPEVRRRWKMKYSKTGGTVTTTIPAKSGP